MSKTRYFSVQIAASLRAAPQPPISLQRLEYPPQTPALYSHLLLKLSLCAFLALNV